MSFLVTHPVIGVIARPQDHGNAGQVPGHHTEECAIRIIRLYNLDVLLAQDTSEFMDRLKSLERPKSLNTKPIHRNVGWFQ